MRKQKKQTQKTIMISISAYHFLDEYRKKYKCSFSSVIEHLKEQVESQKLDINGEVL